MDMKKLISQIDALNAPRKKKRIAESKSQVSECDGAATPAITMTAGTGSELASMFKDILNLAGIEKPEVEPLNVSSDIEGDIEDPVEEFTQPSMKDLISVVDDVDTAANDDLGGDIDSEFSDDGVAGDEEFHDIESADDDLDSDVDTLDLDDDEFDEDYSNTPNPQIGMDGVRKFGDINNNFQNSQVGRVEPTYEALVAEYQKFISEACGKSKEKMTKEDGKKKPSAGLTKKEKSDVVKKATAGKDIGKPGKNFEKVEKAAKKSGAKDPKAVAAAAMWKNEAKKKK